MNQNNSKKPNNELTDYEKFALDYHKDAYKKETPKKGGTASKKQSYEPKPCTKNRSTIKMGGFDDFIPDSVGNIVDSVFGKLDSFVNTVLGEKKPVPKKTKTSKSSKYIESDWGKVKRDIDEDNDFDAPPKQVIKDEMPVHPPATLTQVQTRKVTPQQSSKTAPKPTAAQASLQEKYYEPPVIPSMPRGKIPCISRTTSIAELNLSYPVLSDPDLVKYFNQMKLYETNIIEGGLCGMPVFQAIAFLNRGLWGTNFRIKFEDLKLNIGLKPVDIAKARFRGMLPVYKAYEWKFQSLQGLKKNIEDDINTFLATGHGTTTFHKFTYKVAVKK